MRCADPAAAAGAIAVALVLSFAGAVRADSTPPAGASASSWSGRVEFGWDSFEERYSVADADTLDRVDEWRTRARLAWTLGDLFRDHLRVEGRAFLGQSDLEGGLEVRGARRFGSSRAHRASMRIDASRRRIDASSDFRFPNTLSRVQASVGARVRAGERMRLDLTDRFEWVDYAHRTEFDVDYARNRITARVSRERDLTAWYAGALSLVTMSVPDSSDISYAALEPSLEVHAAGTGHRRLDAVATIARRRYPGGGTRSSFWSLLGSLEAEWPLSRRVGLAMENRTDVYRYDVSNDVYFDYAENRLHALVRVYLDESTTLGAGASWGTLRTDASPDDPYTEFGGVFRVDHVSPRLWVSFEYEPGRRRYDAWDPNASLDALAVYSDYSYQRVSLVGSWRLSRSLDFNVFLDWQPEDHEREGDDATATLFASSLSWGF